MAMPQVHIDAYCVDLGFGSANGARRLALMVGAGVVSASAASAMPPTDHPHQADPVRVATYNLSLNRNAPGELVADLSTTTNAHGPPLGRTE